MSDVAALCFGGQIADDSQSTGDKAVAAEDSKASCGFVVALSYSCIHMYDTYIGRLGAVAQICCQRSSEDGLVCSMRPVDILCRTGSPCAGLRKFKETDDLCIHIR